MTTTDFFVAMKWSGIATVAIAILAVVAFIFQWGLRFRLVGVTGFLGVLTVGLFALSIVPFTRTVIPGAIRYSVVYDNGAAQVAIALPPTITESELEATLRQAASDLFSPGRGAIGQSQMIIRARTIIHPEPKLSVPVKLGEIKRSLVTREDENMDITIDSEKLAMANQAAGVGNQQNGKSAS